jgi:hypothetical protein
MTAASETHLNRDLKWALGDGIRWLNLPALVELKLASGMTNPGRLKDLADVQELIRLLPLPADFAEKLQPFVKEKYRELWQSVQGQGADAAEGERLTE